MYSEITTKYSSLDLLLNEIEVDNENCEFRFIGEYEIILNALKRIFGNHDTVVEIEDVLNELKENWDNCRAFDTFKIETLESTGNEDLAEDLAWELVYS